MAGMKSSGVGARIDLRRGNPHVIAASQARAIHTMLLSLVEFE